MKIKCEYGWVEMDFTTPGGRWGNSAVKQLLEPADPNTEVCFGGLHAQVTMVDLKLRVTMDPVDGNWTFPTWARAQAAAAIQRHLSLATLQELLAGVRKGVAFAQKRMREALGVVDEYGELTLEDGGP